MTEDQLREEAKELSQRATAINGEPGEGRLTEDIRLTLGAFWPES